MNNTHKNSTLYLLFLIGSISAFGPFITDFYLPSLPSLTDYFHTTTSLVQLSLTFGLVGLGVGQLIIGPLSDKYGRKTPLLASLFIFCLSTIGCLFATSIHTFIVLRLVQGLAGAGGVVISRSIATDLYQGRQLARFYSLLASVQGLAPICAPVLGGVLMAFTDWKGIFWILFAIGLLLIAGLLAFVESLSKDKRQQGKILAATFANYHTLTHKPSFMGYVLVQAFAMGVMFSYIASSPFVFQVHFGTSPQIYGLFFGINAFAIMLGSLAVTKMRDTRRAMLTGCHGFAAASLAVAAAMSLSGSVWLVEGSLFVLLLFMGLILPSSTTLALDNERAMSGAASALLGFLMFLFGGVLSPLTGMGSNMLITTSAIIVACSFAACYCAHKTTH